MYTIIYWNKNYPSFATGIETCATEVEKNALVAELEQNPNVMVNVREEF